MNTAKHKAASAPKHPLSAQKKWGSGTWEDGIRKADENWDAYDCFIKSAILEYDMHLSRTPGYTSLDWRLVKAMLWTETGAGNIEWNRRPMQIGMRGDPGLDAVLASNQGSELVVPPSIRVQLSASSIKSAPVANIRAGIGYLLMRMAEYAYVSVPDADGKIYEITVGLHDNIDKIAKTQGSTPEVMKKLNPTAHVLRPGQVLKYQKASIQKVITGWKAISASSVAARYNASAQSAQYASKLNFTMETIKSRAEAACK